jgi:D-glucosaminate-6-phosphate ammonia-lyase
MTIDIRPELGQRQVINVSGTMTSLGASIVVPQAIDAMNRGLPQFFDMSALHRYASGVIADLTGGEAGFVTASCASGITLAVAAAMTGSDLHAIEQLPDTASLKNEVLILFWTHGQFRRPGRADDQARRCQSRASGAGDLVVRLSALRRDH